MDFEGNETYRLKTGLIPPIPSEAEKMRLRDGFNQWRSGKDAIRFAEYDGAIDQLMPLDNQYLMAYQYRASSGSLRGVILDLRAKTVMSRFTMALGESGRLFSSNFQLVTTQNDAQENIYIKRVRPVLTR